MYLSDSQGYKPILSRATNGKLTRQEESEAEGTTDAGGKVTPIFALKPSAGETCTVRVGFGEDDTISEEKKDLQVAALRDLLQVANNGKLSFKSTAPQSYTIKAENCGDNAELNLDKIIHEYLLNPLF